MLGMIDGITFFCLKLSAKDNVVVCKDHSANPF